jgi:hypothetical protein
VRRDGDGYRSDLGQRRREIFLQRGLDRKFGDLPIGQLEQFVGWVEPFAPPIAVVQNMMGIAFAPPILRANPQSFRNLDFEMFQRIESARCVVEYRLLPS